MGILVGGFEQNINSSGDSGNYKIITYAISGDQQLTVANNIHNIENTTGQNLNLFLPASPTVNDFFLIINQITSTNSLLVNGQALVAGDRYEIIFDGNTWIPL